MSREFLIKDSPNNYYTDIQTIINCDEVSDLQYEYENVGLPIIPKQFHHLYTKKRSDNVTAKYVITTMCDCGNKSNSYDNCLHFANQDFKYYFESLPFRLHHLYAVQPESQHQIRTQMFQRVMNYLDASPCSLVSDQLEKQFNSSSNTFISSPKHECHVYQDVKCMFPVEWEAYFHPKPALDFSKQAKLTLSVNHISAYVILCMMLIVLCLSKSLSMFSVFTDIVTEVLSYIFSFFVSIQKQNRQKVHVNTFKPLRILAFQSFTQCFYLFLGSYCVYQIVNICRGKDYQIEFQAIQTALMVSALVWKIVLFVSCRKMIKKENKFKAELEQCKQNHKLNMLSNKVGFVCVMITFQLPGKWKICDPAACLALTGLKLYLLCKQVSGQMKNLSCQSIIGTDELMMRLIHQFDVGKCQIAQMDGYTYNEKIILEIQLLADPEMTMNEAIKIKNHIQNGFENDVPGIFSCKVDFITE
ncbi:Cation_efflux family protein [Hexamita inflata]|uniref:Cation efflux family protein n=1 Tax=Hexamita inflata TaxID=28002 RepID=A0AA86U4M1_9EUKA|nr:Cation efflux family protein [Hexamita inflata]CAI9941855.1 Cation efflux family protein [Hexamita inflata]